jgi:hypothetical protein
MASGIYFDGTGHQNICQNSFVSTVQACVNNQMVLIQFDYDKTKCQYQQNCPDQKFQTR